MLVATLLAFLSFAAAQRVNIGACPKVNTLPNNFNLQRYLGGWYEIAKYGAWFERNQICGTAHYALTDPKDVQNPVEVVNSGVLTSGKDAGKTKLAHGHASYANATEMAAGRLRVRFSNFQPWGPYWILDTDYDTYTVVWSCSELLNQGYLNTQYLWILARTPVIPDALYKKLTNLIESYDIDASPSALQMTTQDPTRCSYP